MSLAIVKIRYWCNPAHGSIMITLYRIISNCLGIDMYCIHTIYLPIRYLITLYSTCMFIAYYKSPINSVKHFFGCPWNFFFSFEHYCHGHFHSWVLCIFAIVLAFGYFYNRTSFLRIF